MYLSPSVSVASKRWSYAMWSADPRSCGEALESLWFVDPGPRKLDAVGLSVVLCCLSVRALRARALPHGRTHLVTVSR